MINRIIIGALLTLTTASSLFAEMTARSIMDEQSRRHRLANETSIMTITLIDRKGAREERVLRKIDKDSGEQVFSLTIFEKPTDIRGTALLTRENNDKANDQWLYFPSQRRMQRIAQSRRNGYFMGTDFTYEDLDPEDIDAYSYTLLKNRTVEDIDCYVIEAIPITTKKHHKSGYGKRVLCIRKDIFFPIRIEFFDRKNQQIKTQINTELELVSADVWRAKKSIVNNQAKHHQTEVIVISRDTQTVLPDDAFSERALSTGRYME